MSALASGPDWDSLSSLGGRVTRDEFDSAVNRIFDPGGTLAPFYRVETGGVRIFPLADAAETSGVWVAWAGVTNPAARSPVYFKDEAALRKLTNPPDKPLRGIRIALDPGHIGGRWARVEERFIVGPRDQWFVQEAALNLHVARLIRKRLEAAGADVVLTKDGFEPVTDLRPEDYTETVEREMADFERFDQLPEAMREADRLDQMQKRREFLFYRRAEIQARADLVNEKLKPDLALCIHFNAVEVRPTETWTSDNRLVIFVSGNYLPGEIRVPEQRLALFWKILGGAAEIESRAALDMAASLSRTTGLPAGGGGPGPRVGTNDYVIARNLAANRLFRCPVLFLEAYYMNNAVVFSRIQAGDYEGEREIGGQRYRSIYRDYADGAADGVIAFYRRFTISP